MLDLGSTMFRHFDNQDSAFRIIKHLLDVNGNMVLDIQRQIIDEKLSLEDTSAGQTLQRELIAERRKHQQELSGLKKSYEEAAKAGNKKLMQTLRTMEQDAAERMRESEDRMEQMRTDYANMQQNNNLKLKETITEFNEEMIKVKAAADRKQRLLEKDLKDRDKKFDQERKSNQEQLKEIQKELKTRQERMTAQADRANTIAAIQGIGGVGMAIVGALTGMNPALIGTGASLFLNSFDQYKDRDEL